MKIPIMEVIKKYVPSIIAGFFCLFISVYILITPSNQENVASVNLSDHSSLKSICELATLKCFYHNVVIYEKQPQWYETTVSYVVFPPAGFVGRIGYKNYWLEYSGMVEMGIDASLLTISEPDENGTVNVYVPDAKVLRITADENTLTEPISDQGWFTSISGAEKTGAFAAAQSEMRKQADNNQVALTRAKENAKHLLEQYIINTGKEVGLTLSVHWVN